MGLHISRILPPNYLSLGASIVSIVYSIKSIVTAWSIIFKEGSHYSSALCIPYISIYQVGAWSFLPKVGREYLQGGTLLPLWEVGVKYLPALFLFRWINSSSHHIPNTSSLQPFCVYIIAPLRHLAIASSHHCSYSSTSAHIRACFNLDIKGPKVRPAELTTISKVGVVRL